ncbi:MAG: heparan-alpha-glucosaminide N-acetyltransferase domain-containing protein [Acidobacteriota bacterium]
MKSRLLFIDIVRGLAVLAMIEGHVSNSTILDSIRRTPQFHHIDLFNGFVSACFIFISGFSLCLVVEQRLELFLQWKTPLWLQIRRLLFILALGYWLHSPPWSLRGTLQMDQRAVFGVFRCDVLQAITLSLFFCLFVAMVLRRRDAIAIALGALALFVVFYTPFLYDTDPNTYVPAVIGTYITAHHNPLFPLFPSAAYTFTGYFFCWLYLRLRSRGKDMLLFSVLLPAGLAMLVGALALFYAPWSYHVYADPSRSSPRHFMMKLGAVLFTLSLVWFYERLLKPKRSYLNMVGQESLFVYGLHLMIVYGCVFTRHSFARDIGNCLTYLPSFTLTAMLIAAMCLAGVGWHVLKRDYPRVAKGLFYGAVALWTVGLLVR